MKKIDFSLVILAIIFSLFFNKEVNQFVNMIIPKTKITLKILSDKDLQGMVLLETDEKIKISDIKFNRNDKEIEFIPKGKYGYQLDALWVKNSNKKIELEVKKIPNLKISFYNTGAQKIEISSGRFLEIIDLEKKNKGEIVDYFPFSNSKLFIIYTVGTYILLSFLIYIVIIFLFVKKKYKKIYFLNEYNPWKMLFIIYSLILLYVSYKFLFGLLPSSLFLNNKTFFGDQGYYWGLGSYLKNGNYGKILSESYSFRGYVTYMFPFISQFIGEKLKINSYFVFCIINNFFISLLLSYILPELHNNLSEEKSKNYHILSFFLIFSFFWKGMYYSILVDMLGLTFLLWMILKILEKKNVKDMFLAGIFGGIASLSRGNYVWTVIIMFLVLTGYTLIKEKSIKISETVLFWMGIILICIPQIKINYDLGHIGLFPFDKMGSYVKKEKLTIFLINETMRGLFIGHPFTHGDVTAQQILKNFDINARLNINQFFSACVLSPVETFILIIKKVLIGLDLRSNEVYPMKIVSLGWFSIANYFVILTFLFFINMKKFFSKKELRLAAILFFSTILPQTLLHVEWRYYILLYFMVYYVFIFKFVSLIENTGKFEKIKKKYFKFILLGTLIYLIISSNYL